ncbi:inner centromere protein-like [Chiroxiphia lanceolata]|uniref:inner centromere protein-like n=1 Tax=Chiroxiphia lanceolata TaxID=296741 RepID=UPI0013CF21AB|nr:inner centromere protein-like [Chiroxiphia lanceolata]
MAEGPRQLLEVCGQRLSRFLHDAQHKRLAWLREVEEQGVRMLESSFRAEPALMPKTPSQRRRPRKRQSSCLKEENKEPNRRRLSRRRSGVKPVSSRLSSQQHPSQEQPRSPGCGGEEVSVPRCAPGSQAGVTPRLLELPGKQLVEAFVPLGKQDCQDCVQGAAGGDAAVLAVLGEHLPEGDAAAELQEVSGVAGIAAEHPGRDGEKEPRTASTSTPKAARDGDPATLQGDGSPQGLDKLLFQDSASKRTTEKPRLRRRSRSRRASLAEKYSLSSRRENMIRRSVSRAKARKAAARESSSASSRVSCQSSLEVFVEEDVTSGTRPELELNPPREKAPEDVLIPSKSPRAASPPAQPLSHPEQQAGNAAGSHVNPSSEPQKNQEPPHCAKSQESPSCIWTRGYKQALGVLWHGQQPGGRVLSPLDDKHKTSASQAPSSPSPASKVVKPLKNFLQAVQRNQLLPSSGPTGRGGGIKDFIKRNTPTRPNLKGDFVEKERQRLENLRKKQEAEEQRKKKVEEEKRRRQAEMKQKREERLRKALQARERVEQMEEEKKKRMEQKLLQSDEKVRDEKVAEERSKRKTLKKPGEADARKQKALRGEEKEQQEPPQKRREDEVKEKGKKVLELKNLLEQQQVEKAKERDPKQRGKEKPPQAQLEPAVLADKTTKRKENSKELPLGPGQEKRDEQPGSIFPALNTWLQVMKEADGQQQQLGEEKKPKPPAAAAAASAAPGTWLSKAVKKSLSTSCLGPPKGAQGPGSPTADENDYGLDLNSDDSTDDENDPRKPVPAWAEGTQLHQAVLHQYYHPVDVDALFGAIPSPQLEHIFYKSKPRYFKRTSSAVWHSPPGPSPSCTLQS